VAICTNARGGLERMLVGSVTDKIVRGATVPTLVVRPTA
jgi:nucleotide-binding universal stress UspA family protein